MAAKLDENGDAVRTQIVSARAWIERVNEWRRAQPNLPSKSEAIRLLVDQALDAQKAAK